jgi:gluconate 2-dehydrogenase gamma chain
MDAAIFEMDRRTTLQRLALLLGATALPADALLAAKSAKGKRFLDASRLKLLTAFADTIVPATDTPGAVDAGVPAKLDGMLATWASPSSRKAIVEALQRIDAAAMASKKNSFAALSVADRDAVLRLHDKAALVKADPPANAPKSNPFFATSLVADQGYLTLKELVIALYYNSEIAMTQELVYEHTPGTWQPSIKIIDDTRPWAGVSFF